MKPFTQSDLNESTLKMAGAVADLETKRRDIIAKINAALNNPKITREQHNALTDHKNSLLKQ